MVVYAVDLRSRKTGNSVETIYSGSDHTKACEVLESWYHDNELNYDDISLDSYVDGSDGVFADIYCVEF